jgi:hypothetical protein
MIYNCTYCKKEFTTKSNLTSHQKTTKYCLKIQGKSEESIFECKYCNKILSSEKRLKSHYQICSKLNDDKADKKINEIIEKKDIIINSKNNEIKELKDQIKNLQDKIENIAIKAVEKTTVDENNYDISWLEEIMSPEKLDTPYNKLKEENKDFKSQIKYLINKCVKKQPRIQYKEKYVIYVLTTALMKKERRYILGKAKDLTNRLSTYNKSDEHEVVYYQSCGNQETMSCVENMVFEYLKKYREKANRERFILPETEDIKLFISAIKKSVEFFNISE